MSDHEGGEELKEGRDEVDLVVGLIMFVEEVVVVDRGVMDLVVDLVM